MVPCTFCATLNESQAPSRGKFWSAAGSELGAAGGLWGMGWDKHGIEALSFTMLTVNADGHGIYGRLHEPGFEERMTVILHMEDRLDWLFARCRRRQIFAVLSCRVV